MLSQKITGTELSFFSKPPQEKTPQDISSCYLSCAANDAEILNKSMTAPIPKPWYCTWFIQMQLHNHHKMFETFHVSKIVSPQHPLCLTSKLIFSSLKHDQYYPVYLYFVRHKHTSLSTETNSILKIARSKIHLCFLTSIRKINPQDIIFKH